MLFVFPQFIVLHFCMDVLDACGPAPYQTTQLCTPDDVTGVGQLLSFGARSSSDFLSPEGSSLKWRVSFSLW